MADEFVTVASYNTSVEANMAKNCLAEAGVLAYLTDDTTVDMAWHLGTALGGVKLQVKAHDAERAEQILAALHETNQPPTGLAEADASVALPTPAAPDLLLEEVDEPPPNVREQTARRAARGAVLGLLLWPLQLYVFWLLMQVFLSDEPLTPATRRLATIAACINLPLMAVCCWLLGQFL